MTQLREKRSKQKKNIRTIVGIASGILLLAAFIILILFCTGVLEKKSTGSGQGTEDSVKNETDQMTEETDAPANSTDESESTGKDENQSGSNQSEENQNHGSQSGENQNDGSQSGENQAGNAGSSHTLNNPQVGDLASLDNTTQNWGPGNNVNEKNQPHSTLSYQKKYEKYNANFIVPDSDKVYLTFDEGYENGYTPAILDTLKEKNVSAVFFVTSQFAKKNPQLVQRMIDEGHAVGNHSVTHPSNGLPSQSIEKQQQEVMVLHDYIKENFNYEMHLFRYPAGKFSDQSLAVVNNCNYKSVFWSFAYLDYDTSNQPEPTGALNKLMQKLHPGAIYLLHAVSATNTEILGDFIDQARAAGYEFALFD